MDNKAMPILRMEVEGMKASILTHLGARGSELGAALSAEIDKAIAEYDWQGNVKRIVHATLSEKIQYYFKFGEGAKAVQDAVVEGFDAVTGKGNEAARNDTADSSESEMTKQPILESLRRMKTMAINMGQKPPFIARIGTAVWDALLLEIDPSELTAFAKPMKKGIHPKMEGIEIHVFDNYEPIHPFILYDTVNDISLCNSEPAKKLLADAVIQPHRRAFHNAGKKRGWT